MFPKSFIGQSKGEMGAGLKNTNQMWFIVGLKEMIWLSFYEEKTGRADQSKKASILFYSCINQILCTIPEICLINIRDGA